MGSNDPFLIIIACPTEANARLMVTAMREIGIEQPTAVCRRSEARAVLAENISPLPKVYNQAGLDAIAEEKTAKVERIIRKEKRNDNAVRSRIQ